MIFRNLELFHDLFTQDFMRRSFPNKRDPYAFGLGKRDPYAFGLGKRLSNELQRFLVMAPGSQESHIFGLTKRGLLELGQRKREPYAFGLGK